MLAGSLRLKLSFLVCLRDTCLGMMMPTVGEDSQDRFPYTYLLTGQSDLGNSLMKDLLLMLT